MTPERKKWWDSLPQGERELREAIANHEKWIKINKLQLSNSSIGIDHIKKMMRRHKLITKALKHELERGGSAELAVLNKGYTVIYGCTECDSVIAVGSLGAYEYKFCPYCGRKLKRH